MLSGRRLMAVRTAFIIYGCVLLLGTHWPRLEARLGDIPRPDLYIHLVSFGLFTLLLVYSRWFGPLLSFRNLSWAGLLSLAFALLNEASQGLPIVQRQARFDDGAANVLGVAMALSAVVLLGAFESVDEVERG